MWNTTADEAVFCSSCGERQVAEPKQQKKTNTAIVTANKVLLIISCVGLCVLLLLGIVFSILSSVARQEIQQAPSEPEIDAPAWLGLLVCAIYMFVLALPLAWVLPMTIHYFKKVKAGEPLTVAFKICTLLFVNLLVGIFMLCFEPHAENA